MFCVLCKKHDTKNGNNHQKKWNMEASIRYKRSKVELHGKSQQHQNAVAAELSQSLSFFHREIEKRDEVKDEVLYNAFLCAYWIAKQEISNRNQPMLIDLLQLSGVENMNYFTHRSARSLKEIFLTIGQTVQEEVLASLPKCTFFGLLVD